MKISILIGSPQFDRIQITGGSELIKNIGLDSDESLSEYYFKKVAKLYPGAYYYLIEIDEEHEFYIKKYNSEYSILKLPSSSILKSFHEKDKTYPETIYDLGLECDNLDMIRESLNYNFEPAFPILINKADDMEIKINLTERWINLKGENYESAWDTFINLDKDDPVRFLEDHLEKDIETIKKEWIDRITNNDVDQLLIKQIMYFSRKSEDFSIVEQCLRDLFIECSLDDKLIYQVYNNDHRDDTFWAPAVREIINRNERTRDPSQIDNENCFIILKKYSKRGDQWSKYRLARWMLVGRGCVKDTKQGWKMIKKLADENHFAACEDMYQKLSRSDDLEDLKQASHYYKKYRINWDNGEYAKLLERINKKIH